MIREISKKVTLVANFGAAYTGLATVGYKLWNGDATQFQARTTTNVAEIRAGTGAYKVEVANSVFTADFDGYVEWDTGGSSPVYAYEDIHITAILDHALSDLDSEIDTANSAITAIKAKTDNLPADPADASDIAALIATAQATVDAIKAKTDNLPSDPADASDIAALIATAQSAIDAIKAKTDLIPAAGPPSATDYTSARAAKLDNLIGETPNIRGAD